MVKNGLPPRRQVRWSMDDRACDVAIAAEESMSVALDSFVSRPPSSSRHTSTFHKEMEMKEGTMRSARRVMFRSLLLSVAVGHCGVVLVMSAGSDGEALRAK